MSASCFSFSTPRADPPVRWWITSTPCGASVLASNYAFREADRADLPTAAMSSSGFSRKSGHAPSRRSPWHTTRHRVQPSCGSRGLDRGGLAPYRTGIPPSVSPPYGFPAPSHSPYGFSPTVSVLVVVMVASSMLGRATPGRLRLIMGEDGSRSCFAQVGGLLPGGSGFGGRRGSLLGKPRK